VGFRQQSAALKVQLPSGPKGVLNVLAFHACELCGRAWPGVALIALETGLMERSVREALVELRRHPELLTVYRYPKGGRGMTTEYLVMPGVAKLSTPECGKCSNRADTLHLAQGLTKTGRENPAPGRKKTLRQTAYQPSVEQEQSARAPASGPTRTGPNGPDVEPSNPPRPLFEPPLPTTPSVPSEAAPYVAAVLTHLKRQRDRSGHP